jgi:hypothetical protein
MLVICDHRHICKDASCTWAQQQLNGEEILNATCDSVREAVNIHKVKELDSNNPNDMFERKKHGF